MKDSCYLLNLPNEVLERIIHLVSVIKEDEVEEGKLLSWKYPEYDYNYLECIGLCCKKLYVLCLPFLWKDKEFILPGKEDNVVTTDKIQMATEILSKKVILSNKYLGDYVKSLNRDLTNSSIFDLDNTLLMAKLVGNLRSLRIDFNSLKRTEHYGLCYFFKHCPRLIELHLNGLKDTFNDFSSIVEYKPKLVTLTLINCTIKEKTLIDMSTLLRPTLKHLLIKQLLIEPEQQYYNMTEEYLLHHQTNVLHTHNIVDFFGDILFYNNQLTQLALTTDSINANILTKILKNSVNLEKLVLNLNELNPLNIQTSIMNICKLKHLTTLSLNFKKCYPIINEIEKIPCHLPFLSWLYFSLHLPVNLKLLHITSTRILLTPNFMANLLLKAKLKYITIHNVVFIDDSTNTIQEETLLKQNDNEIIQNYLNDTLSIVLDNESINQQFKDYLYTIGELKIKGFYFDESNDQICFIKGYSHL